MGVTLLAFGWGFAEATLFFVVADVVISIVGVRRGRRAALWAALAAAAGATVGGICIALWARYCPDAALDAIQGVPAISETMVGDLRNDLDGGVAVALLVASVTGVPYKIGAVLAPAAGIPIWQLALLTPMVRLPRFTAAAVGGALLRRWTPRMSDRGRIALLGTGWSIFYAVYWTITPN